MFILIFLNIIKINIIIRVIIKNNENFIQKPHIQTYLKLNLNQIIIQIAIYLNFIYNTGPQSADNNLTAIMNYNQLPISAPWRFAKNYLPNQKQPQPLTPGTVG